MLSLAVPPSGHNTSGPLMPFFPFDVFDPVTRRLPPEQPFSAPVNDFLDGYCDARQQLEEWNLGVLGAITGGDLEFSPLQRLAADALCPMRPQPRVPAASIYPPIFASGCQSSGNVGGFHSTPDAEGNLIPDQLALDLSWTCGENKGLPIAAPVFGGGPTRFAWFVECERANGTRYFEQLTPDAGDQDPSHFTITAANFNPCPGCNEIPVIPIIPRIPRPPGGYPPVPAPQIDIDINLPQLPGFPDLVVPITFAPQLPALPGVFPLVFAPTINLPSLRGLIPNIELNLGGLSIGGGGWPVPAIDVSIDTGGGDGAVCPDPCEPVDYAAIAQIVFDELDLKFPPFRPFGTGFTDYEAADSRQIVLPDFPTSIDITITELSPDITSYSGGTSGVPVVLAGWYSFGDNTTVGARLPISYGLSSILVPKGARGFSYTLKGESLATVRVNFLVSATPPD